MAKRSGDCRARRGRGVPGWWVMVGMTVIVPMVTTLLVSRAAWGTVAAVESGVNGTTSVATGGMTGQQCATCHRVEAGFSHPTGRVPAAGMTVPAGLPLEGGKVTCVTCHENSMEAHSANTAAVAGVKGALLRMDSETMCGACHTAGGAAGLTRAAMHARATTRAHGMWAGKAAAGGEDRTRNCLACHDGTAAGDAFEDKTQRMMGMGGSGKGHPSGVAYSDARRGEPERNLRTVATLDRRVRLFNGQVGCESCHSVYSGERGLLVMENRESRLCVTCHEMR